DVEGRQRYNDLIVPQESWSTGSAVHPLPWSCRVARDPSVLNPRNRTYCGQLHAAGFTVQSTVAATLFRTEGPRRMPPAPAPTELIRMFPATTGPVGHPPTAIKRWVA